MDIVSSEPAITSAMLNYMTVYNTVSANSDKEMETYLMVPQNSAEINNYIKLRDRASKTPHALSASGAIITEKLADSLKIGPGDVIRIMINDEQGVNVPVAAVAENYALHYIYMSKDV